MRWQDCLTQEAEKIVGHGQGKLELFVTKRKDDYISIQILAGKRFDFQVKDYEED